MKKKLAANLPFPITASCSVLLLLGAAFFWV